jgi:hypothetical protein
MGRPSRDACCLKDDDWRSLLGFSRSLYSGPAMLWWALVGNPSREGGNTMSGHPLSDLLTALAVDMNALAALASASREESMRALGAGLSNLHRHMEVAAEIALRLDELEAHGRRIPPGSA